MWYADIIQWPEFRTLESKGTLFYFIEVLETRQCALVLRSELTFKDGICQVKVALRLLIALKEKHAAAEIVVDGRSIHRITSKRFLSDIFSFQIEPQGNRRLLHVVRDRPEATIREGRIRMIERHELDVLRFHVELQSEVVFASAFVDGGNTQLKE